MTVETQQGKPRPRTPRPGEHATALLNAVNAAPLRDPKTGRWLAGNQAGRLRTLKRTQSLITLNPTECAAWVRPYVELAPDEAADLVLECAAESSPSLKAFAEDAANAAAFYRALLAIAVDPSTDAKTAREARSEARAWLKERRQALLSLRAEARAGLRTRDGGEAGGGDGEIELTVEETPAEDNRE